jgi:aryl-alcohol dehydrogenase-like predicted oxidoreductase
MQYRTLGRTGLNVSAIAFGAGPISTLMVGDDVARQMQVVGHAIERGVNWFDTAATYGGGQSERSLGRALAAVGSPAHVQVATKVRLTADDLNDIPGAVRRSFAASLERLGLERVTLLQLHNSITARRGDEPTSITPDDVLGPRGIAAAFEELRADGLIAHLGLTGIGQPTALSEVVRSGRFDTMQVPYHLLNPSAGCTMPPGFSETNFGNIIGECARMGMGVLAIRVFAGGALLGNPPSPHTFKTPFFPLALYDRDRQRARRLQELLGPERRLSEEAVRFALAHPQIQSAIIGFGDTWQIDEAIRAMETEVTRCEWNEVPMLLDRELPRSLICDAS